MKKALFLVLAAGVLGSLQAQNDAPVKSKSFSTNPMQAAQMRFKTKQAFEKQSASNSSANQSKRTHNVNSNVPKLPFLGSSANVNGVLDATTTAVTANQACKLIVMTHRDNNSNIGVCGTGAYIAAYSTNGGTVWDTTVSLFCGSPNGANGVRYPNGVIFNPAGNANPANAYDAMSGPYTNGAPTGDSWVASVYGSVTFGGAHPSGMYWFNPPTGPPAVITQNNGDLSFMSSSDDSTVHVIGEGFSIYDAAGDFGAWQGAVLTTGKFNPVTDSFDWTQQTFRPHIISSYIGFQTAPFDSDAAPLAVPGTAWSQDGKIGYVVLFANLDSAANNFYTDQPIVYKTTNSGKTWSLMPMFNFRNIPSLTQYLVPTADSPSVKIPIWYTFQAGNVPASQGAVDDYDLTVDYNGNLHIMGAVVSSVMCNPDSSFTVVFRGLGYIYDVYTSTPTGGWKARFIDSMATLPLWNAGVYGLNSDWDSDVVSNVVSFVGFGNRLQASRTTDGKHIFCTWEDDLSGVVPFRISFPDVLGQGYDVATNTAGPVQQFTKSAANYFLCASDIVTTTVSGTDTTYTVPCTIAYPQGQGGDDGSLPINYYYLDSVVYNHILQNPASVPTIPSLGFSISPNYPNPFNNITQFNIGLTSENLVSVDVFNLFGQKVYSIPAQQMSSGNHLMTIKAAGWSTGVYLYRVNVGDQSKTQKMVVQ